MRWMQFMSSFMACEPPSSVPVQPTMKNFQASGPRRARNSVTIFWLPGGRKSVKSRMASRSAARLLIQLEAKPTAMSRVGKKARNTLKAMACEIMLHRGKTRPSTRQIFATKDAPGKSPALFHRESVRGEERDASGAVVLKLDAVNFRP